ncbi:MAG: ATP-binding protein [Spirochaetia bacterium]|nr:ATP-binding protein [Spirochaetia bacterium]
MIKISKKIFKAKTAEIPKVKKYVEKQLVLWKISEKHIKDIVLVCDEASTNIVTHAYNSENAEENKFEIKLIKRNNVLKIVMIDSGKAYNILNAPPPDIRLNLRGEKKGGFGVFLMKNLMDRIRYRNIDNKNMINLVKITN